VCVCVRDRERVSMRAPPTHTHIHTQRFDVNNSGTIDFQEFCIMMGPVRKYPEP